MGFKVIENNKGYKDIITCEENKNILILAYFTASWCEPCKIVSPVVERIGLAKDTVMVLKVDVDNNEEIAEEFEIDCMPTFLFYKNQSLEVIERFSGADLNMLVQKINNNLEYDN